MYDDDEDETYFREIDEREDEREAALDARWSMRRVGDRAPAERAPSAAMTLTCVRCGVPYVLEPWAASIRAAANRALMRSDQAPIDDVCEPCHAQDRLEQARGAAQRRQAALRADRRLRDSVRPGAVEASDWQLVRNELGEQACAAIRSVRGRRSSGRDAGM